MDEKRLQEIEARYKEVEQYPREQPYATVRVMAIMRSQSDIPDLIAALRAAEERARVAESVLADIEHQVMLIDASGDEINREAKFEALRIIAAVVRPKEPTE